MSFVLFYLLRRLFVKLDFSPDKITISKGFGIVVTSVVPLSEIVRVTVKRSLLMRLFRAKKVKIFCNRGKASFYLRRDEPVPFIAEKTAAMERSRFREELLGAFCDTHALGGIALLSFALFRISRLFGSEYSKQILDLLSSTSQTFREALSSINIQLPSAAVGTAVFAVTAWCFAFICKVLSLCRFRTGTTPRFTVVQSGVVTLYEHYLCHNSTAVREDGLLSLILGYAPVRMRGVMVRPAVKRRQVLPVEHLSWRALWGHCKWQIVCTTVIGSALAAVTLFSSEQSGELHEALLLSGLAAAVYSTAVCIFYIRFSGIADNGDALYLAARHSLRLYTAELPKDSISAVKISYNLFKRSRANISIVNSERLHFKIRQIELRQSTRG